MLRCCSEVAQAQTGPGLLRPGPARQQQRNGYTGKPFPLISATAPTTPCPQGLVLTGHWPQPGGDSPGAANAASGHGVATRQSMQHMAPRPAAHVRTNNALLRVQALDAWEARGRARDCAAQRPKAIDALRSWGRARDSAAHAYS